MRGLLGGLLTAFPRRDNDRFRCGLNVRLGSQGAGLGHGVRLLLLSALRRGIHLR